MVIGLGRSGGSFSESIINGDRKIFFRLNLRGASSDMMGVNSPGFELGLFSNGFTGVVAVAGGGVGVVVAGVGDLFGEIECDECMWR